ncbi:MAG: TetR family transcriptional regulator [Geminicoccaceae bacterium]|jgi:AcrR family transcriptional regulator|nr:TetR family transcriptional regulator [Geminicoccaceae bacterium]
MSPRPRTVSDDAILAVTARVISRVGPAGMTLADVGAEVGLAPATLVQRFGSKRGLLLAVVKHSVDSVDRRFVLVRERAKTALDALFTAASDMAEHIRTPEALVHNLAFFQLDLSDPEFHRLTLDHSRRVRAGYTALLDEAVRAGELSECNTRALASVLQAVAAGSVLNWAIHREGTVLRWVRSDLETVLAPYRRAGSPGRRRR